MAEGAFAVAEAAVAAAAHVAAAEETVAENIGAVRGCCGTTGDALDVVVHELQKKRKHSRWLSQHSSLLRAA